MLRCKYLRKCFSSKNPTKPAFFKNNEYLKTLKTLNQTVTNEEAKAEIEAKVKFDLNKVDNKDILSYVTTFSEEDKYLKSLIQEEMSEEEFASSSEIRFKTPPQSVNDLFNLVQESDKIYEDQVNTFFKREEAVKQGKTENFLKNIPKYLTINTLKMPKNGSSIVLLGVHKFSGSHSSFVTKFLEAYEPNLILTQISPDEPFFIRANGDYRDSWNDFIRKGRNYDFLVNPLPTSISDLIMDPSKTEEFIENLQLSEDFLVSKNAVFSKRSQILSRNLHFRGTHPRSIPHSFPALSQLNLHPVLPCFASKLSLFG